MLPVDVMVWTRMEVLLGTSSKRLVRLLKRGYDVRNVRCRRG